MEQEGDHGRGGEDRRRMKEIMQQGGGGTHDGQVQPQQPEKCPRCDSLNTKFCYYNNYSLAQPRHYCKTCKRYWTIGGTLRNVPVGGGSRKGNKRPKNASSSTNNSLASRQQQQPQPPPPQEVVVQTQQPNLTTSSLVAPSMINPFYQAGGGGGGYLSSFAAIHSVNQSLSHPFDQPLNAVASSNLGLVSAGFNNVASLAPPQRQIGPSQFYQMGRGEREVESLYMPEQALIIPSSMANSNSRAASQSDWTQSFNNNAYNNNNNNNRTSSDASLWSTMISTTSMSGNSTERNATAAAAAAAASSSPLFPNQWPDLPGFGSPP